MAEHVFTGFGFGPIQSGLFVAEAFRSGNFSRIVVAEIDGRLVDAIRRNEGRYYVNIAGHDGIDTVEISGVELLNPNIRTDRAELVSALGASTEVATCLPSVNTYDAGDDSSIAALLAEGLGSDVAPATIIYAAENNNRAAENLERAVAGRQAGRPARRIQYLNTVIGKMSQVVADTGVIGELGLRTIAPEIDRAFLVEQFNRILVSRTAIEDFRPGIDVFIEKDDLLPFEEAKLYGHNAIHALLAFVAALKGYKRMTQLKRDRQVMRLGRDAFIQESGAALIRKYESLDDELFTEAGYTDYADDLLERMTNPYLADTVARASRDVVRKLGYDDRIFGTMRLAVEAGIEPRSMAVGALAGLSVLLRQADEYGLPAPLRSEDWRGLDEGQIGRILAWLWQGAHQDEACRMAEHVAEARNILARVLDRD